MSPCRPEPRRAKQASAAVHRQPLVAEQAAPREPGRPTGCPEAPFFCAQESQESTTRLARIPWDLTAYAARPFCLEQYGD
eukprot:5194759-Lingulodinium_polyedra.AAC.1